MSRAAFLPSRRTLALLALAAVVIGGAAWWTRAPTEPVYEGRRLSEWLYQSRSQAQSFVVLPGGRRLGVSKVTSVSFSGAPGALTRDQLMFMGPDAIVWLGYAVERGKLARNTDPRSGSSASSVSRFLELLRKWLHFRADDTYDECAAAARVLRELRKDAAPAIPALLRALGNKNEQRANNAWNVLNAIGPAALAEIRHSYVHGSKLARLRIARQLPYVAWFTRQSLTTEDAANLQEALAACDDADSEIRGWAAVTVAECSSTWGYLPAMEKALQILIAGLSDTDATVRIRAASYLPLFRSHAGAAIPRLIELLNDTTPAVRLEAVKALSRIDERGQASRFRELLDDPDPAIRDSAKAYLFRLSQ
jgi:HEAT repeat protein